MTTFIDLCLRGEALPEEIDHFVDEWHAGDSELSLKDYLGFTSEEYSLWLKGSKYLPGILASRKHKTPLRRVG